jgi:hypothetical protein
MSDTVHVRSESGALLYFAGAALPPGIADRIRKGDLVRVTEDGEPWDEAAETTEALADAAAVAAERDELRERVAELEAQLAATRGESGSGPAGDDPGTEGTEGTGSHAGGGAQPDGEPGGEPPPGPSDAPPLPSVKEVRGGWTEFAISQGMDRAEANSLTKQQLIERLTTAPQAP